MWWLEPHHLSRCVLFFFYSYCFTLLLHICSMSCFSAEDISSSVSGVFFSLVCLSLSLLLPSSLYLLIHPLELSIKEIKPFFLITGLLMLDLSLSTQSYPELLIVDFLSWQRHRCNRIHRETPKHCNTKVEQVSEGLIISHIPSKCLHTSFVPFSSIDLRWPVCSLN